MEDADLLAAETSTLHHNDVMASQTLLMADGTTTVAAAAASDTDDALDLVCSNDHDTLTCNCTRNLHTSAVSNA